MKKIVILLTALFMVGCGKSKEQVLTLENILKEDNYQIVDVRTDEEYKDGHVVGAINIPYDKLSDSNQLDKTKTIMVYCKSGKRSAIAYTTLKNLGYEVFDLGAFDSITLDKE